MDKQLLRRWGWLMAVTTLLVGGTSFAVSRALPPTYSATATLLVQEQASTVTGLEYNDVLAGERLARTYSHMILTHPVLQQVIGGLGLATTPEELSKRLSTRLLRDTPLIQITAEDRDPLMAQRLANAVTQSFMEQSQRTAGGSLRLIEPAVEPTRPARPNLLLNTLAGLLVGLLGSVGLALLLQYTDDTLKAREDATRALGLTVLGVVHRFRTSKDRTKDLVTVEAPHSAASESYRILRTNVQFSALDVPLGSIVVTSAARREGKSTVAANLAVTMARVGKRVLLVDADLRHPSLRYLFDLPNCRGLADLLLDDGLTVDSVALDTHVPGLRLVPSGPQPPNPADVLGSQRMRRAFQEMHERADVVVLDSPPVLAVADGLVLAAIADATLLVVRSGSTRRTHARCASEHLNRVEARLLGVVVNAVPWHAESYGYDARHYVKDGASPSRRNGQVVPAEEGQPAARES